MAAPGGRLTADAGNDRFSSRSSRSTGDGIKDVPSEAAMALTVEQERLIWSGWRAGDALRLVARWVGCAMESVRS